MVIMYLLVVAVFHIDPKIITFLRFEWFCSTVLCQTMLGLPGLLALLGSVWLVLVAALAVFTALGAISSFVFEMLSWRRGSF